MDVGVIIRNSILRALEGGMTGGLPHPSLICALCDKAGVKWKPDEPIIQPMALLDHKMIMRYKVWGGGESHPRGLGFIIASSEPQQDLPPTASGSSSAAPRHVISDEVELEVNRWMYRLEDQNVRLAERQDAIFSYNVRFNTALVHMFASMNPTFDSSLFPVVPTLPVFPPSDQES